MDLGSVRVVRSYTLLPPPPPAKLGQSLHLIKFGLGLLYVELGVPIDDSGFICL